MLLRCKRADCRRRMEVDLRAAIQAGRQGAVAASPPRPLAKVQSLGGLPV
jgi:hypothetical protein